MGNYWLIKVSSAEWEKLLSENKYLSEEPYDWLKRGDYLITYVKGSGKIKGVFQVTSEWCKEEGDLFKVDTKSEAVGEADYETLCYELDFIKNKEMCWVYLIDTPGNFKSPIPPNDAAIIMEALAKGEQRP